MPQLAPPKITPFLWFDADAEEAATYYASIFPDSKVQHVSRGPGGKAFSVTFELAGQRLLALNGGPQYAFTPAISLFVSCEDQAEVDRYWDELIGSGGRPTACGWLTDRFGLSWQIIPNALGELLRDPSPMKAQAVMQAMLKMQKIDVAALHAAHAAA